MPSYGTKFAFTKNEVFAGKNVRSATVTKNSGRNVQINMVKWYVVVVSVFGSEILLLLSAAMYYN